MMKRNIFVSLATATVILCTVSCSADKNPTAYKNSQANETPQNSSAAEYSTNGKGGVDSLSASIPREIETIPQEYYSKAEKQGKLEELYYDTYESMSYDKHSQKLKKRAIVYLPYGYSDKKEYDIFYLMHGGWSDETGTFGTPDEPANFKNVIDNAIEKGEMKPMIIVCPTYNNKSGEDSSDFSLALTLNQNYHNELLNDLIPAAESTYSTYAKSTSEKDLKASRSHRGFGGFSMGSVATWRTFQYALDYFKYFMPMSCGTTLDDDTIFSAADNAEQKDYFVFMMTGTEDFAYSYDNSRADKMRDSSYFTEMTDKQDGNFIYLTKEGYSHDGTAASEYTYNGLKYFWKNNDKTQENTSPKKTDYNITEGTETYKDFTIDNVLHTKDNGDIHFNLYVPKSYDGSEPYAIYFSLPGYGSLYFQGVGSNLHNENFVHEAKKYNDKMLIVAPQLNDWGETSADQTIALTEYFLDSYNIDRSKVYANGYSGGGETMSLVMGKRPDLYCAYLQCSSQWDGDYQKVVENRTPVYFVVGGNDEYYSAEPSRQAYDTLYSLYKKEGLTDEQIDSILVLDIKKHSYFTDQGMSNEHGGGDLFAKDKDIMGWLFKAR